jgi:hypothetical protein
MSTLPSQTLTRPGGCGRPSPAPSLPAHLSGSPGASWHCLSLCVAAKSSAGNPPCRRLDCGLLLYVSALRALPLSAARALPCGSADDEAELLEEFAKCGRARCASLLYKLSAAGHTDGNLLRQLLQSGGGLPLGAAAAATFAQATLECLQASVGV